MTPSGPQAEAKAAMKELRRRRGDSQMKLAFDMGYSVPAIAKAESTCPISMRLLNFLTAIARHDRHEDLAQIFEREIEAQIARRRNGAAA